jgi:hypothetical protein
MVVSFLVQIALVAFCGALVSMTYVLGLINRQSQYSGPLRYLGLGFLFLALNNFFVLLTYIGINIFPFGYEGTMLLTLLTMGLAMLKYSEMTDRNKGS